MNQTLTGKSVAILATDGFEQSELESPRNALRDAGADAKIVSPKPGSLKAWDEDDFGDEFEVDVPLDRANPDDYDALLLPGGVMNPDQLRMNPKAVEFVRAFFDAGKPVAAICHGPQMLIEAGVVRDRKLTSYPSLQTDLRNAGATWVDEAVVTDNGLVTSRRPADLAQFNAKMVEEISEGVHAGSGRADLSPDRKENRRAARRPRACLLSEHFRTKPRPVGAPAHRHAGGVFSTACWATRSDAIADRGGVGSSAAGCLGVMS